MPRFDRFFLAVCIIVGALLRLDFMRAAQFAIDGDEAIVGLMARHIVEGGKIPVFYYGQHYMGSLEALLVAGVFSIFGPSAIALQIVPMICSLLLILVMYSLGRELAGRTVGLVAALLTAVPPVGLVVWSVKARGGFIEILLIGAWSLLLAVRWWKVGASNLRYPALLGLLLGLGFWTNNQIIYFIGPIALFSWFVVFEGLCTRSLSLISAAASIGLGSACFFIGSAPFWVYNFTNDFSSFGMYGSASMSETLTHVEGLFSTALPILLGAKHFWELESAYPFSTLVTYCVYGAILGAFMWSRRKGIGRLFGAGIDKQHPIELILVLIVFSCAVFAVSTFGWLVQAPRYLLPIYVGVFLLVGYVVSLVQRQYPRAAAALTALVVSLNILSAYAGGRAVPGEPVVFKGQRVSRDHQELIATLAQLGITKVRTNYWIGYRLAFETGERVTFSMFGAPHQVRLPQYEEGRSPTAFNNTPILVVPAEAEVVRDVLATLGSKYRELTASGYVLFYDIQEGVPSRPLKLSPQVVRASGWGSRDFSAAIDGDGASRWGTGAAQVPGQTFRLDFSKPQMVGGLSYDLGAFLHDYPRGLRVDVQLANGAKKTVLSEESFKRVAVYLRENRGITLFWPPERITALVLTQTESDPVFDWSIAELYLYEPAPR